MLRVQVVCAVLVFVLLFASGALASPTSAVASAESVYADLNDSVAAISTIESGYAKTFGGKDLTKWKQIEAHSRQQLTKQLAAITTKGLSPEDARAAKLMRDALSGSTAPTDGKLGCADSKRADLKLPELRSALYACFREVGNNLSFEGKPMSRTEAFGLMSRLDDAARRKAVFFAMSPLYEAINGNNQPRSPYRRLVKLTAAENTRKHKSELDSAAKTTGVSPQETEKWLERILEIWRDNTGNELIEPWDYRYRAGAASRKLSPAISRASLETINGHFYNDLGADLKQLGVIFDLHPRAGKSPVAYTDFARRGRMINGQWQPTVARVLTSYGEGGLGNLHEFVHENGHAAQISAIRTRPAFMDWGDTLFVEAFADVPAWSTYDSGWQKKYLGESASENDNLRELYSGVMLDVTWALFEIRMLKNPAADPNQVWTDITSRYLHIAPHPEVSWWAVRGQLADAPGYMVNYGLGAVVTAEIRARTREKIGAFDTGNLQWYPWLTENLLRFGTEHETFDRLRDFLGRTVSPDGLLSDLRRVSSGNAK
jgi:hypothetical protein